MPIVFSSIALLGSVAAACAVERFVERRILLERCSGLMLVIGLSIIGASLPLYR